MTPKKTYNRRNNGFILLLWDERKAFAILPYSDPDKARKKLIKDLPNGKARKDLQERCDRVPYDRMLVGFDGIDLVKESWIKKGYEHIL